MNQIVKKIGSFDREAAGRLLSQPPPKRRLLAAVAVLLLVITLVVLLRHEGHHAEVARKYRVTKVWKSNEKRAQDYVGQVRAIQHIELRALERGYLKEIYVDEGQSVKQGQKMFRIMPIINNAEYKKADAEADLARLEYQNTKILADGNIVSKNELALSNAKFQKARAARELARAHLDLTEIKAPFDGIMGRFNVRLGSLLEEGELLTTLSDNSKMWVYFNVSEAEYLNYRAHSEDPRALDVQLVMANGEIFESPGKVETIEADFNNETGNIAFRATFPNPKGILRHGETGNVRISVPLKNVLIIPQNATFDVLDKKFVYVVDDKSTLRAREIVVAEELPHLFVVTSGLNEGERILLEGLGRVKQGDHVEVDFLEPAEAIARLDVSAQ